MILLKANANLKIIFNKLINTMGLDFKWIDVFIVNDNNLFLAGKDSVLLFDFGNKTIGFNPVKVNLKEGYIEQIVRNEILENILNMTLYVFGKWGKIKGLTVEKDYTQLNKLFENCLYRIKIEPVMTADNLFFYREGNPVTYEKVIQFALDDMKRQIEEEDAGTEDTESEEAKDSKYNIGLWHKIVWKSERYSFKKVELSESDKQKSRIGNNFYMVPYVCPVCKEKLYMVVYPIGKELLIETDEKAVYIARAYTCHGCHRFFTPKPDMLLMDGNVFSLNFEDDKEAYEDYLELIGKRGRRTSNSHFNRYEEDAGKVKQNETVSLERICNTIDSLSDQEILELQDKMDSDFYPLSSKDKYYVVLVVELERRRNLPQIAASEDDIIDGEAVIQDAISMDNSLQLEERDESAITESSYGIQKDVERDEDAGRDVDYIKEDSEKEDFAINHNERLEKEFNDKKKSEKEIGNEQGFVKEIEKKEIVENNANNKDNFAKKSNTKMEYEDDISKRTKFEKEKNVKEQYGKEKKYITQTTDGDMYKPGSDNEFTDQIENSNKMEEFNQADVVMSDKYSAKDFDKKAGHADDFANEGYADKSGHIRKSLKGILPKQREKTETNAFPAHRGSDRKFVSDDSGSVTGKLVQHQNLHPGYREENGELNDEIKEEVNDDVNSEVNHSNYSEKENALLRKADTYKEKNYANIKRFMEEVKKEDFNGGLKESIVHSLKELLEKRGKKELDALCLKIPDNISRKQYEQYKDMIEQYRDIDTSVHRKRLDYKRDTAEKKEIAAYIKQSNASDRSSFMELYQSLKKEDFEERNITPYLEDIYDKISDIDEETIREICPEPADLTFEEGIKVYEELSSKDLLPELKSSILDTIDGRLTKIKMNECELLVNKLSKDMSKIMPEQERIHFYDARGNMRENSENENRQIISNALHAYAGNRGKYEFPILICDASAKADGGKGFVLTPDRIYYNMLLEAGAIDVMKIKNIYARKGVLNTGIYADTSSAGKVKIANSLKLQEVEPFVKVINEFVSYLKEKPESRDVSYMVKEKHSVKCCLRCGYVYKGYNVCPRCGAKFNE